MKDRRVSINIEDGVRFSMQGLKWGSEVSKAKHSGYMAVNHHLIPFILIEKVSGRLSQLSQGIMEGVTVHCGEQAQTKYTKCGYVKLSLTFHSAQLWVYIKREHLRDFYCALLLGDNG